MRLWEVYLQKQVLADDYNMFGSILVTGVLEILDWLWTCLYRSINDRRVTYVSLLKGRLCYSITYLSRWQIRNYLLKRGSAGPVTAGGFPSNLPFG